MPPETPTCADCSLLGFVLNGAGSRWISRESNVSRRDHLVNIICHTGLVDESHLGLPVIKVSSER